jgi:hypothetical protein
MIPKISLTAAFLLIMTPPMACASNRAATSPAVITCQAHESQMGMVVAQDSQGVTSENDNDNDNSGDSNDSADDNQNGDNNQTDQENAATNPPPVPPQVLGGPEDDPDDAPQINRAPQQQPANPYQ